jgi:hypothetical protein
MQWQLGLPQRSKVEVSEPGRTSPGAAIWWNHSPVA